MKHVQQSIARAAASLRRADLRLRVGLGMLVPLVSVAALQPAAL